MLSSVFGMVGNRRSLLFESILVVLGTEICILFVYVCWHLFVSLVWLYMLISSRKYDCI